jgi:hypothetical protein
VGVRESRCATRKNGYLKGKAATPQGEGSMKRPSDAEVASTQLIKQSKKAMPCPAMITADTGIMARVSGSKGMAEAKKTVVPVRQCCDPAIGVMA